MNLSINKINIINITIYILFIGTLLSVLFNKVYIYYFVFIYSSFIATVYILIFKHYTIKLISFLLLLSIFLFFTFMHELIYSDPLIEYIILMFFNIVFGYLIGNFFLKINFSMLFYIVAVIEILFILIISPYYNDGPLLGNTYYLNRTYYTVPLTLLFFITTIQDYLIKNKYYFLKLFLFSVVALISFSRSTMILSFFLMIVVIIKNFRSKFVLLFILIFTITAIYLYSNTKDIASISFILDSIERIEERGMSSGRYEFWSAHLTKLDSVKLLFGYGQENTWKFLNYFFRDNGRHTLHSVFLQVHLYFGIIGLFIIIYFFHLILKMIKHYKGFDKIYLYIVLLIFIAKSTFETMLFIQRYDYLFFGLLFFLNNKYLKEKGKRKKYNNEKNINNL